MYDLDGDKVYYVKGNWDINVEIDYENDGVDGNQVNFNWVYELFF